MHVRTHTYIHHPGAPKHLMAHGPVVLVGGLNENAHTHAHANIHTGNVSTPTATEFYTLSSAHSKYLCVSVRAARQCPDSIVKED